MEWLRRFSFHRKLQASFLILILFPFIAVTFWSYSSVKQNVSDKLVRSNEETLTVIANQIGKTIDSISFASVYFSQTYNPDILESFRHLKDAEKLYQFRDVRRLLQAEVYGRYFIGAVGGCQPENDHRQQAEPDYYGRRLHSGVFGAFGAVSAGKRQA
ncbi:hypothetical protein HMSSN139_37720 [Paenibacillus sp. HMSSN-139]|nr:hypothetical protein HMSSN139_37720 [Paenibacillus sp. HMSSN-139]